MPEVTFGQIDSREQILAVIGVHRQDFLDFQVYGSLAHDLTGDGRPDVLVGYQFPERWTTVWEGDQVDVLAIYTTGADGGLQPVFRTTFDPGDTGRFQHLQVEDLIGDGIPEISVVLRYFRQPDRMYWMDGPLDPGGEWRDQLTLFRGRPPFDVLLELTLGEGRASVLGEHGEGHYATVSFADQDGDGVNEVVVTPFRQEHPLAERQLAPPEISRLIDGVHQHEDTP